MFSLSGSRDSWQVLPVHCIPVIRASQSVKNSPDRSSNEEKLPRSVIKQLVLHPVRDDQVIHAQIRLSRLIRHSHAPPPAADAKWIEGNAKRISGLFKTAFVLRPCQATDRTTPARTIRTKSSHWTPQPYGLTNTRDALNRFWNDDY